MSYFQNATATVTSYFFLKKQLCTCNKLWYFLTVTIPTLAKGVIHK